MPITGRVKQSHQQKYGLQTPKGSGRVWTPPRSSEASNYPAAVATESGQAIAGTGVALKRAGWPNLSGSGCNVRRVHGNITGSLTVFAGSSPAPRPI